MNERLCIIHKVTPPVLCPPGFGEGVDFGE